MRHRLLVCVSCDVPWRDLRVRSPICGADHENPVQGLQTIPAGDGIGAEAGHPRAQQTSRGVKATLHESRHRERANMQAGRAQLCEEGRK